MGKKIRKMTVEDHFNMSDMFCDILSNRLLTNVINSYYQNSRIVKYIWKLKKLPITLKSDLEEEFFKEFPDVVKLIDTELGYNEALNIYYGDTEKRERVKNFLIDKKILN